MKRLFIIGQPSLYGGADTELHHQIILWSKKFSDSIELHIIPTNRNPRGLALYNDLIKLDVTFHNPFDFSVMNSDDACIAFCSGEFLKHLSAIHKYTRRIMWVNCMTYLFDLEKENARNNFISHYLYQRPQIKQDHSVTLSALGANAHFMDFIPYFEGSEFSSLVKTEKERTHIGRISRADAHKYSKLTNHIYEYIVSPQFKQGHFLGFNEPAQAKIGRCPSWITTYKDHKSLSVKEFYSTVDFIVQPSDTTENWPRIGFEAMTAGVPLVVDRRGGWQHMIEHGVSGFLCSTPQEFIYWGSRLSFEPELRQTIIEGGKQRALALGGESQSAKSWQKVFDSVYS